MTTPAPIYFYRQADLESQGFVYIRPMVSKCGQWEMFKIGRETDTPLQGISAFRFEDHTWHAFLKPGRTLGIGYTDIPVLPPSIH